jgi:uncharacterized phiE125 gp8 family phage protein
VVSAWQAFLVGKRNCLSRVALLSLNNKKSKNVSNLIPIVVTGPTFEPVTVAQARKQVELAESDRAHDEQLELLIQAAREQLEADADIVLGQKTIKVYDDDFDTAISLQLKPIQSITSIKYYDTSNNQQTLPTTYYDFDQARRRIELKYMQAWPAAIYSRYDAVEITYVCGYTSQALVPALAKQACLLLVGNYFEGRDMLKESDAKTYDRIVAKLMRSNYP